MASTKDSVLAHCIDAAIIHEQGGIEAAVEKYGAEGRAALEVVGVEGGGEGNAEGVARSGIHRVLGGSDAGGRAGRVLDHGVPALLGRERAAGVSAAGEFRELWPEFETPNEFARKLVTHLDDRTAKKDAAALPMKLEGAV